MPPAPQRVDDVANPGRRRRHDRRRPTNYERENNRVVEGRALAARVVPLPTYAELNENITIS